MPLSVHTIQVTLNAFRHFSIILISSGQLFGCFKTKAKRDIDGFGPEPTIYTANYQQTRSATIVNICTISKLILQTLT